MTGQTTTRADEATSTRRPEGIDHFDPPIERRSQLEPRIGIDSDALLAYLTRPLAPLLTRIRYRRHGQRGHQPKDILLPAGYRAELVATGFNTPVHCCFDADGYCYVVESGHKVEALPRILKVDTVTGSYATFFTLPEDRWIKPGAVTGAAWHGGSLYLTNTNAVSRIAADGSLEDIVTDLPWGDHMVNHPVVGPDGFLYFGVGSATNSGVVGPDNLAYEWLRDYPRNHDVPAGDVTASGFNVESHDILGNPLAKVRTGPFVPYATEVQAGEVIGGEVKANGILRCRPDGSELEVVAWGLRNPFGLAFSADGRLWATEHGMDDRNRHIIGDYDDLYEIRHGEWYGWPDFCSGIRIDHPIWGPGGQARELLLAEHPNPDPPKPFVVFPPHAASNGLDFSRSDDFGFAGDAFVALFGDVAPVTTPRLLHPVGYKVVRVDMKTRRVVDFAVNRIHGPASKLPHDGFERPSHCSFGPDGALYVVDWGEIEIAPEAGGLRMQAGSGSLWRIVRVAGEPAGERPPKGRAVPFYALQNLVLLLSVGAIAALGLVVLRRVAEGIVRLIGRRASR